MEKLVDHFNTLYFHKYYATLLAPYLRTVKEIDIAGARICLDAMKEITGAVSTSGLVVRDSADPERDWIFQENRRRAELKKAEPRTYVLQVPTTVDEVKENMQSLNPDLTYAFWNGKSPTACAYAFLVMALRPEIKLHLQGNVRELFLFIYEQLRLSTHPWKKFYVLNAKTFYEYEPPEGQCLEFFRKNVCVPYEFGREVLAGKPEWAACLKHAASILEKNLRPTTKKIKDYLS